MGLWRRNMTLTPSPLARVPRQLGRSPVPRLLCGSPVRPSRFPSASQPPECLAAPPFFSAVVPPAVPQLPACLAVPFSPHLLGKKRGFVTGLRFCGKTADYSEEQGRAALARRLCRAYACGAESPAQSDAAAARGLCGAYAALGRNACGRAARVAPSRGFRVGRVLPEPLAGAILSTPLRQKNLLFSAPKNTICSLAFDGGCCTICTRETERPTQHIVYKLAYTLWITCGRKPQMSRLNQQNPDG